MRKRKISKPRARRISGAMALLFSTSSSEWKKRKMLPPAVQIETRLRARTRQVDATGDLFGPRPKTKPERK